MERVVSSLLANQQRARRICMRRAGRPSPLNASQVDAEFASVRRAARARCALGQFAADTISMFSAVYCPT